MTRFHMSLRAENIAATKQRIASYKAPRRVILASVPRFPNGKPDFATARTIATGEQS